ncbi:MAG: hypothetical protein NTX33_19920 [Propionibacteriales bacterium]|nr:hypothetical protein [Propionibacteriales bacterium]
MTTEDRHPSALYLLGALVEDDAEHAWALNVARIYQTVLGTEDDEKVTALQWALSAKFLQEGLAGSALAIICLPSSLATYETTARDTFNDLGGVA